MTTHSASRAKRVAAGSLATAVALSGLAFAAAPASAAPDVVRVHLAEFGQETSTYPATKWFFGKPTREGTSGTIVDNKLVMKPFTQVLTELKGAELPATVAEIIDEDVVVDSSEGSTGDASIQIALGWQGGWTTLRPAFDNAGDLDPADQWLSSKPVGGLTTGTLGELAAAIDDSVEASNSGVFAYAAVGVLVNNEPGVDTSIDSITVNEVTYAFVDSLPAVAKTTKVQLDEIGAETVDGYADSSWFFGLKDPVPAASTVVGGNLVLPVRTQLLHELTGDDKPTTLQSVVASGLAVTTTSTTVGRASLQIAAGWEGNWTTLRPADEVVTKGENVANFDDENWISSRSVGGITTGTLAQLVSAVDAEAAGDFRYVAVGANVFDGAATVSNIQVGAEKYTFADDAKLIASVAIAGAVKVGSQLTATTTAINYSGTTATYQWYNAGKAIKNAKSVTYTPVAADRGDVLTVKATFSKTGFAKASATSAKTAKVAYGTLTVVDAAAITGTATVGVPLTASADVLNGTGAAAKNAFVWYSNGSVIKSATKSTYSPVFADLGKAITVKVTSSYSGYTSVSSTSGATVAVIEGALVAGNPTLSGTAKVGKTLTAKAGTWAGSPTLKYGFYAGDELVQLSASTKLVLTWDLVGEQITVKVTGVKQGYASATSGYSAATVAVVK